MVNTDMKSVLAKKKSHSLTHLRARLCALALLSLSGCSHYEIAVNENTVYDPLEFRRSLHLADEALQACVKAALIEQDITTAGRLRQLVCGPGDIQSLAGLEIFENLEVLGLADNRLTNISALAAFTKLKQVNLENNSIGDASPLGKLKNLSLVNLAGNEALRCDSLPRGQKTQYQLPAHCR